MAIRTVTRAGVGLVVGIIILAALVFAGLWFVQQRGETARREEAINVAEQRLEAESEQDVAINPSENESSNEESQNTEQAQGSAAAPQTGNSAAQPSATESLPQTGSEASSIIIAGFVTFVTVAFIRSRKLTARQQ